jgi:uncharacterized protein YndB with AHSA1/START domain
LQIEQKGHGAFTAYTTRGLKRCSAISKRFGVKHLDGSSSLRRTLGAVPMHEPLEIAFTVDCSPKHAFDVWTTRTSQWWPHGHSRSGDPDLTVAIEPRVGGRIFERTSSGTEHEWGEVLLWEPPNRLSYMWHIYGDRSDATQVEISFIPEEGATKVTIVHRGWERLGARGEELRKRNRQGWAGLISHYEKFLGTETC